LDQNNNTIENAKVEAHITFYSPDANKLFGQTKDIVATTDNTGLFRIEKEKGRSIYIDNVSKEGYEYNIIYNTNRYFQYYEHGFQKPFIPDKNNPVIFRLRKQNDTAFLFETLYWKGEPEVSRSQKGSAQPRPPTSPQGVSCFNGTT